MLAARIEGGMVVDMVVADPAEIADGRVWVQGDGAAIGYLWDGATLTPPAPAPVTIPQSVTMRQARLALLSAGLLDAAHGVIDALPMPQRRAAQIEWEYALSVRRDHPLIALMISEGLATEAEVDGLFVAAAGLL